jgi:hypothetical protein
MPIAIKKEKPGLITIQKFVFLLSDFYYTEFTNHLAAVNATLPLKLAKTIRQQLPAFHTHQELCTLIYGSFEKGPKQNFNQLAAYTFRLSNVLAQNYPDYLHHNVFKIQRLVNEGQGKEANFLAEILLEIAERTDDFQCQIFVLNFLSQQAFIARDHSTGLKLDAQLNEVVKREVLFTDIQLFTRKTLAKVNLEKDELEAAKTYLLSAANNDIAAIRILARHSYLLVIYQFHLDAFEQPETAEIIEQLEKDLHNQSHVVFPYLLDLRSSLTFMKLNSTFQDLNSKESERELEALAQHYMAIKYWKTFVNTGQLHLIAIQCTRLFNLYETRIYRSDYMAGIEEKDAKIIKDCLNRCKSFLQSGIDVTKYEAEVTNYRILYGVLLVLAGAKNIKTGSDELESVLANNQHLNLNTETDSIFMCLMLAYLALKDYHRCAKTFKRYIKSIAGKPVFEDNDFRIHAYYYLSQWLSNKNRKDLSELFSLIGNSQKTSRQETISAMKSYFNLPDISKHKTA